MDTYIPPNIRLINPISKRLTTNQRFISNELPTWVEQSQDLMLRSTVSFLIVTYSGTFLSFNHLSFCIFSCPLLFLIILFLCACQVPEINKMWFDDNTAMFRTKHLRCMALDLGPKYVTSTLNKRKRIFYLKNYVFTVDIPKFFLTFWYFLASFKQRNMFH